MDCSATPDAEITIDVTSGSGSYDYEITDGTGTVVARTGLPSNPFVFATSTDENYTITVYDNNTSTPTCSRVFNVTVPPVLTPSFNITSFSSVTCNGDDNGTINVSAVENSTDPYSFQIISGPSSTATFPIAPTSANNNSASFDGLEGSVAGITYTIRITAANGCTSTLTQVITQPEAISNVNASVVEFGCTSGNNTNNATITVDTASITGGSTNYVIYEFINDQGTAGTGDDVVVQSGANNSYIETNTAGGTYIINVYDDQGCVGSTTAAIAAFDELLSASAAIDVAATCVSGEDITITATGSITNSTTHPGNYQFRLLPSGTFQASGSFAGLAIGSHDFEVMNTVTGCIIPFNHVVANPAVLNLNIVNTTDITCFGDTNGTVEIDLQDATSTTYTGATSYTLYYDVNNTPTNLVDDITSIGADADGAFTISGLAAGTYFVEVIDDNPPGSQCTYSQSFNIAGPNVGLSANTQVAPVTCSLNDGSIEIINAAGGWGGYTYFVGTSAPTGPGDYVASPLFQNLAGGATPGTTYQVWIKDQFDCEEQLPNVILVDPDPITATLQINNPNCTNIEGEIEVVGTAGGQNANYTFQLRRNGTLIGSPQIGPVFTGLGAGLYVVEIADQFSCTHTTNSVELFDEIVPMVTLDKPIDCTVDPGGHVTVSQNGGSGSFTYAVTFPDLSTPQPTNNTGVFTDLTMPGTYSFTITDDATGHTCVKTITLDLDNVVTPVITSVVENPVNCNGGSDGSLTVMLDAATAVNPIYTYELYEISNLVTPFRTAQTSNVFDNLPAGDYRVRVISGRSCDAFFDETVTEPIALSVSASANTFTCNASNMVNTVTITAVASDGTGPYLYSIDNVNFQTSNTFDIVDTGVTQNITVYVRDANNCLATDPVSIEPINVFSATVTQIPGLAISCANPEGVLITVTDNGIPTNTYTYTLLPVGNTLGTLTGTPTNTTATFDLTAPGTYTFRVTDTATGCYVDTAPYEIVPFDLIDVVATPITPILCFGDTNGEATINVTGYSDAYDYEVFNADGTTTGISGSGNSGATNPLTISNLPGGNFYIQVRQTANPLCIEDSNVFTIASPDAPLLATPVEVANVTCANNLGEIEVSPTGGYPPYDIILTNTTTGQPPYTVTDVTSFVFSGLSAGSYTVQITDDNCCSSRIVDIQLVLIYTS
ncbi:MAG: prealbumin-like fold domain-containing protein, partial [Bacteroidota bacterium]